MTDKRMWLRGLEYGCPGAMMQVDFYTSLWGLTEVARSNDAVTTSKVKARFVDANRFSANHVKVVTEAGTVYLMGMVTQAEANAAVEIARTTGGVRKVVRIFEILGDDAVKAGK